MKFNLKKFYFIVWSFIHFLCVFLFVQIHIWDQIFYNTFQFFITPVNADYRSHYLNKHSLNRPFFRKIKQITFYYLVSPLYKLMALSRKAASSFLCAALDPVAGLGAPSLPMYCKSLKTTNLEIRVTFLSVFYLWYPPTAVWVLGWTYDQAPMFLCSSCTQNNSALLYVSVTCKWGVT